MTEHKFNQDVAKRLYDQATSVGNSKVSENDFYNNLDDQEYAKMVYNRYKTKYGVDLLDAHDENSFLNALGHEVPYVGHKTESTEPKLSLKRPEEPKKENKVETPESFNTRIPNIQTVKDDVTGEDVYVDIDIPTTPDMTVKTPNSMDRFNQSPLGESNLSKRIFGVDSILELETPQEKAWKEVYNSAPEAMANLGKDEVEEIYDANGEIIGEKVIRTANEADLDRIQQIQQGIKDQYDAIDEAEGEFIKQYEEYLQRSGANNVNIHGDSWNLVNPWDRRKSKQEMEFIRNNAARYNRIMTAKKALNLQSKFAQTYADLAEYDRSVEKGEQMSAMVSSGEITEDAMKILRATKSPEASRQYIERQVMNGTMSRETANKLLKMGDLSEKNAFGYGFTHPGYAEDFLTFGMSEIKRNFDIKSINDRLKSGKYVSDDEKNALLMYSKMSDMMNEAKMDKRGWVFEAGQGLPKTLQFIAEIGITGGASAVGKGFTRKMILESIKKYGFWKAGAKMAKETGGRLVKNAWQQAIFSPITPSSYVDYSNRVLNMSLEQENISWQDRVDALYKSYAQTWAGRFSETLDNVLLDMPVGSWLYGSKYMKPVLQPAAWIAKKMEGMPWSKQTSNLLERFGIDGMHKEILTEMADPVLQSIVTGDTEELKKMWDDKEDFAKTVALHSAILGGFHGAMGYGVGAATAAIESQRVSKAYDDAMNKINNLTFVDKQLNDLKDELVASINTNNYVAQEGKNNGRTVGEILSDMDKRMQYYATTDKGTAAYESDKRVFDIADYASRVGAFKYGASQNIKDQIARRMGVAKDENGNAIPMEFEHTDGNVYEFTDIDGKQYFILDNSDSAVVLMDRATGEKVIKNKSVYDAGSITQTNGNDWAMNNYLLNIDNWKAQDTQANAQQAQQPGTTVPPTQAMLRGVPVPITNFDAQTGEVTVTDQTGEELTLPVNTPNLELVYPTQQTEQTPVQPEETLQPTEEENVTEDEQASPTEEAIEAEMQEPAYVAPRGEDNDIVWNEVPAERFKQVIDEEVGSDYADGYIDMRIEDAQRKLNEHNEKQKPIASGEYKAFMEESKKLESNLAYWTNAKQEYANAVAQEVAAQSEVETPAQEETNEVAPESTVMYDAKQQEQIEAESPVQVSKEELDANVAGWKSNGINVNVVNSIDEVTNEQVLADMKKGVKVTGWYDTKTGEVYVFAPNITDTAELDSTVIHEVVAHKGLRGLIGEKYYEQFCEKVFDSMPKELQDKYMAYPGVNGRKAAAADEYIAYLAEKEDLTAEEQKFWDRIIQFFRDLFDARLVSILKKNTITDADISKLIRMSYANIKNNAQQEADTEVESQSQDEAIADNGVVFENDTNGQAMYSIKTYREGGRDNLVNFAQKQVESNKLTQEQAEEIVSEMDSIYEMIQQYKDVYQPFGVWSEAEVKVDDNGKAVFSVVKPNGEYDMNLDFSLVCKKRRTLDSVFDEMIKRGIISEFELGQVDVAKINEIIREFGFETACRLCFVDAKRFRVAQVADQFCAKYNELVVMNDKQLKQVIKTEEKNSVRKKIAKHLLEHPEDKVILSRDNFMSANGFENIKVNKAAVMSLYNQAKGTGGPKASFGDVQYLNEIADSSWTPEKAYAVGGVRLQSFSDYVPRMVFDYIQMVADLAAKKLPVHSYTKESTFAKQFGLTGIKINMSLVPKVDADGVAPGLDKDGNYAWQEGETFPFDEAIAIQNAEGYKDNCGTIAVGISDEHILKMLDDENIRMVIPYHKSGLNKEVAKFNNIDQFVDYTNSQNTRYADGKKLNKADSKKHFNFNEDLHKNNDPRGAAQRYLEWCDEKGYIPKFEQFRNHPNYYKLLEDFTTVVTENGVDTVVPQKAVEVKFPKETDAFGSLETLIQQGLEEDAVLEGRRSEKIGEIVDRIEETLPKNNPTSPNDGPRYRTSAEIDKEYPNWMEGTTKETGKKGHSTQVTKTVGTYNKVGSWIESNLGKDVEILDASSGMGLGTQSLREQGFNIEDVEPYQSAERKQNNPATYSAYADIDKQYDYIISNAVLNVIPDDWRADVLHNMADRMKDGGKMFINTRMAGQEKDIKDKIELDSPQEVLVKTNGKISSYQKFFTPQELKSWVEQELGDGYTVEVANEKNSGTKGLAAVVVTKNSTTDPNGGPRYSVSKDTAENKAPLSERSGAVPGNSSSEGLQQVSNEHLSREAQTQLEDVAKIQNNTSITLNSAKKHINAGGFSNIKTAEDAVRTLGKELHLRKSKSSLSYYKTYYSGILQVGDKTVEVRISTHPATGNRIGNAPTDERLSIVVYKNGEHKSKGEHKGYDEYTFYPEDISPDDAANSILKGIANLITNGEFVDETGKAKIQHYPYEDEKGEIRYRSAQPFYSNAERAVQGVKQEKATPEQWLAMLTKNGGLKASEDRWIGLSDWLKEQKGSVTKQEILDYINANKIEIEEVNYDEGSKRVNESKLKRTLEDKESSLKSKEEIASIWRRAAEMYKNDKSMQAVYQEAKIKLDSIEPQIANLKAEIKDIRNTLEDAMTKPKGIHETRLKYTTEGLENKKEIALTIPNIEPYNEGDEVHFGDAGNGRAVAWVRFGDMVEYNDETGTEDRVLVIDEIQSKRHQDAREKGYSSKVNVRAEQVDGGRWHIYDGDTLVGVLGRWDASTPEEAVKVYKSIHYVPDAPFEKNWHELAMKRMLRYAAENGYARVAWTAGATQAERYSLAKVVNSIEAEDNAVENFSDGTPIAKTIHLDMDYGESIRLNVDSEGKIRGGKFDGNTLSNVVGKDLAARLMEKGHHHIYGDGLTIGGEGMRGFYDKMLVDFMNKYGKKWGVKAYTEMSVLGEKMHFIDVTDAMVRSVMEGQPMFRVKSDRQESIKTRQRAENIMKDAIAPMAAELGVEVNYVTNESISDVEPGARKKRQSKGWYQDGKVYINLSTHETIADAKETYLHEVVAHYGLRGLLKEQFEPVMQKVFASLTPTQQQSLLEIFADEVEAAEEFLASMAENDIDPTIVEKVIGFIREALRSMGINLDNYTDGDLQYLLWRSKNNLKENAGNIETARWEAKDAEMRYRTFKNGRLSANSKYGAIDKRIEELKDTAWSVKLLQDEIIARGGIIDDTSDPYGQSTLMPQRSSHEINLFNERVYKPMLRSFSKAAKSLSRSLGISRFEANERLEDYLYARHAIERNKKLAIDKMVRKASESFADLSTAQRAQLVEIATEMYEDEYTGGNNGITTKSAFSYSEQAAIRQSINEWISEHKEVNESGLTDKEAQDIIDEIYTNQSVEVQSEIIRLSDGIRNCTEFILDTWLKYGIISKADHDTYLDQYRHYVPLRGWTEKSDIDYDEVAGNAYNRGETLISLNRRAKGRTSKADSPLAYISQMATSAIIYGNKNLMKEMAFNMVKNNYDLIKDLAFIEDKGVLTHKTNQEVKAHEVQLKVKGRTTRFSFREDFEVGVAAATAIKGENVQNIESKIVRGIGAVTRMQSRLRTSWNPVFMTVNAVRDLMFGNLAFPIKYGFGNNLKLNKNYCIGFAAAFFDAAGIPVGGSKWRQEYEAYKREGGQTGYVHMDDIKRLKRETSKILRRYQNGLGFVPQDIFKLISYVLRVMGEPAENAMRFATFKTLKDSGISERQAAMASKEITVNFNRTGAKKWPGMLYGFFNATLEGTANYFRMGFNKETAKRFWMVNAALAALSYTLSWWAKGFGEDDDDELMAGMSPEELAEYKQMKEFTNEYNRISDYVKHTNMLLPIFGDGENGQRFMAIPVAQSFRMASALGTTLFDMINNDQKVGDELREFAWFVMGEIQPFDVENVSFEGEGLIGNVGRAISPTPILPLVEVYQNRNFMGLPIYEEQFINEELQGRIEPSYTIAGRNTPEFLIGNAEELNKKLGGNKYISAKEYERFAQNRLDAHGWNYTLAKMADALSDPASVDHVLQGIFGGFYELGAGAVERYASDDETSVNDWVLAKRFVKEATMKPGSEKYHERREYADHVKRAMKNEMSHIQTGEGNAYLNEDPYCNELVEINEIWRKNIKELTDAISMCKMGGNTDKAEIERLEAIRDELVLQAALEFEKLERRYNK